MPLLVQFALAALLFYLVNWIGKHSSAYGYLQLSLFVHSDQAPAFNFILKTFTPSVFIILLATGCYALKIDKFVSGIVLVAVYYFGFRLLYNLLLGRALLLDWASLLSQTVVGIGAAYFAYIHLIVPRRPLFPDLNTIGNQLWIVVALFLYAAFNSVRSVRTSDDSSARRKKRYITSRFSSLRASYGDLITEHFSKRYMELVAYAILVNETFNRPWLARALEHAVFPWHSRTIGPMQVRTSARLSDRESVHIGVCKLNECFESSEQEMHGKTSTLYEVIRMAVAKYNRDELYVREVLQVLHVLWAQVATEYRTDFERMYAPGSFVGRPNSGGSP